MTDQSDDAITIDLTHPYEADWMARGRKESEYTEAFRDRLQDEYDLSEDQAGDIGIQYFSDRFRIHEREWDVVWEDDREPGEAVAAYLGEARVELAAREQTGEPVDERLQEQAEQERVLLEASREIEQYLKREGYDDIEISGFGPWNPTSPLELDDGDEEELLEGADPIVYLGEERIKDRAEEYVDMHATEVTNHD